jgi:hypothetical protein
VRRVPPAELERATIEAWLRAQGAEVLAPTNAYELVRFRARGGVHVIYEGRRGITANGFAETALKAYEKGSNLWMGITTKPRDSMAKTRAALLERDGNLCFFCALEMPLDDMTVEHLVGRAKGGPDHQDNLALAHEACNRFANNLPLMEKIKSHRSAWMARAQFGHGLARPPADGETGQAPAGIQP